MMSKNNNDYQKTGTKLELVKSGQGKRNQGFDQEIHR